MLPPWPTVFTLAGLTDTGTWVLVGGLMVQVHAIAAGVTPPRPTSDVDVIVDVAAEQGRFSQMAAALRAAGFEPQVPDRSSSSLYRFIRGKEIIDVMVPDHLPSSIRPRFMRRPAFAVDAGAQAVLRRQEFEIAGNSSTIRIGVPSVLGALIAKGAAHQVDQRDRLRHLQDGAALFASIRSVAELPMDGLSRNDKRRLRHLIGELSDSTAEAWLGLEPDERRAGHANAQRATMRIG